MSADILEDSSYRQHPSIPGATPRSILTRKERAVIQLIADGVCPQVIAPRPELGEIQLRACLDSVFAKLAMSGRLILLSRKTR